ncbi:enoyl-CoA hydratase-related protein [Burkholderia gladioli]|uniref:enoyl-CoA hydratase-related protein n=2 Tax=Burkholderia gladioli TaxID=28095 RepID=UPI001F47EE17|nr:enoyl-CoA hydratase-related protein [Burkholderia gladioli]
MSSDHFQLDIDKGVAHLQLSRPDQFNVMDRAFFTGLRDHVRALDQGGEVRALVISSTGKHFSAGMDFQEFARMMGDFDTGSPRRRLGFQHALAGLMNCFDVLDKARFPVICAVQGGCIGGGLDLAAACDIRLCSTDAFFCLQETQIGMTADLGVLQRLGRLIPAGAARQMAYTSERVGAERALALGLVNAVLPDAGALLQRAMELAREIAAGGGRHQARDELRARPRHRRIAAPDGGAAERDLRSGRPARGGAGLANPARSRLRRLAALVRAGDAARRLMLSIRPCLEAGGGPRAALQSHSSSEVRRGRGGPAREIPRVL